MGKPTGKPISIEEEAFALYQQGFEILDIALKFKKSERTIYRYLEVVKPKASKKSQKTTISKLQSKTTTTRQKISKKNEYTREEKSTWDDTQWNAYFGTQDESEWTNEQYDEWGKNRHRETDVKGIFQEIESEIVEINDLYEFLYENERELLRDMVWEDWKSYWVEIGWRFFTDLIEQKYTEAKYWNLKWPTIPPYDKNQPPEEWRKKIEPYSQLIQYLHDKALREHPSIALQEDDQDYLNYPKKVEVDTWLAQFTPEAQRLQIMLRQLKLSPEEVLERLKTNFSQEN